MGEPPLSHRTRPTVRDRVRSTHNVMRAHPTGRITLKLTVAVLGGAVMALGIALIPLPGPGWLIVFAGLSIWAIEFVWARHLLGFGRKKLHTWTQWVKAKPLPARLSIGAAGLLFVATVALLTIKYSFGINVLADAWQFLISD